MTILKSIIHDSIRQVKKYVEDNLFGFSDALNIFLPFLMFFIGKYLSDTSYVFGLELLIPFGAFILIHFMRQYANRIGKGITIPTPRERFTECRGDGEVAVHYTRLQEMILYVSALEDWLKQNGLTENEI